MILHSFYHLILAPWMKINDNLISLLLLTEYIRAQSKSEEIFSTIFSFSFSSFFFFNFSKSNKFKIRNPFFIWNLPLPPCYFLFFYFICCSLNLPTKPILVWEVPPSSIYSENPYIGLPQSLMYYIDSTFSSQLGLKPKA